MKSAFKKCFFISLEFLGINACFRYLNRGKLKTLMYHSISPSGQFFKNSVSAESFAKQINYLSKRYSILKMTQTGQIVGYDSKRVNVLLTFDDGFVDNYTVAVPILARFNMSAIFFVITECLREGQPPSFIKERFGEHSNLPLYKTINTAQARELLNRGMNIGSHSCSHFDYTKATSESGLADALESKVVLEKELGVAIESFAFPLGRYQPNQIELLKKNYRRIFTTEHGFNSLDDCVFYRNEVSSYFHLCCTASGALDSFSTLLKRLNGDFLS
ncbi:polysaccharide deacetylase family protein [Crenothrix sp.]|uniref:polysaccharide deacetylase family protein n=1 Tax=Crenothrix sp. TaxID=3100433 RepID=UPI00374CA987